MKIIDIFIKYGQGLVASGNILLILLGMLIIGIGFLLAIIAYIFKIGFKVFFIFLDESLFFSIKGYDALKQNVTLLQSLLFLLYYYLIKFVVPLFPDVTIPPKPFLPKNIIISIIWNILKSAFYYCISLIIVIISIYWLLSYVEIVCKVGDILLSLISIKYSLFQTLNVLFSKTEIFVFNQTGINIFNMEFIWFIRLIGFASIFYFRFFRLKREDGTMELNIVLPFKSRFTNKYWSSQSSVQVKYKWIFSVLFLLFISGVIYSSFNLSGNVVKQFEDKTIEKKETEIQSKKKSEIQSKKEPEIQSKKETKSNQKMKPYISIESKSSIKFDKSSLDRHIKNAMAQVKAQEYDYAIKILDDAIEMTSLPSDIKKQIIEAQAFIKANEKNDALKLLKQINNQ
jgi:hypothetical protein